MGLFAAVARRPIRYFFFAAFFAVFFVAFFAGFLAKRFNTYMEQQFPFLHINHLCYQFIKIA